MNDSHNHAWTHDHVYLGEHHGRAESRTRFVVYLTAAFMVVEIIAGLVFGSMALLADGVHMATHVGALGLAAWAYWMARRHAKNRYFTFGSGKFGDLAGFASALILGVIAIGVGVESVMRLYQPVPIQYLEAMIVAALGLGVNIVSAVMLHDDHDHDARRRCRPSSRPQSARRLCACAGGRGDLVACSCRAWSRRRVRLERTRSAGRHPGRDRHLALGGATCFGRRVSCCSTSKTIRSSRGDIRKTLEQELGLQVADLHLWRLGPGHRGLIVSLVSAAPCTADEIKNVLRTRHTGLSHVTIEVAVCEECARLKWHTPQTTKAAE